MQQNYTIRDDFTYSGLDNHVFKVGGRVEITDIEFNNQAYIQPRYTYRREPQNNLNFSFPAEARLGLGKVAVLQFVYPASAVGVDWLVYGRALSVGQLVGVLVMLVAMVVVGTQKAAARQA